MTNKFKKIISLFMMITLCFIVVIPAFAGENKKEKVVFSADEIIDMKEIEKRLSLGISDDPSFKGDVILNNEIVTNEKGEKLKIVPTSIKATSQKVKETINENGLKKTEYVGYIMAETSAVPISKETTVSPMVIGSETVERGEYDTTYSTRTWVKVSYEYNSFLRTPYVYELYKFNSVYGKVDRLDSLVALNKLVVKNNAFGDYYSDIWANNLVGRGGLSTSRTVNYPTSGVYYSVTPVNYYWNTACGGSGISFIRADVTSYNSRGTSSWTKTVTINITN